MEDARRQAEFEAAAVVTDFSEIWRLRGDGAEPSWLAEPELHVPSQTVERLESEVWVERRLGLRRWRERETVTVFRTVPPASSGLSA